MFININIIIIIVIIIISHQSSVISDQSSAINHQSSVISDQSSVINHQSSIISHQLASITFIKYQAIPPLDIIQNVTTVASLSETRHQNHVGSPAMMGSGHDRVPWLGHDNSVSQNGRFTVGFTTKKDNLNGKMVIIKCAICCYPIYRQTHMKQRFLLRNISGTDLP